MRVGGARFVVGPEREDPLVEGECVVCPANLGAEALNLPKYMCVISDVPLMQCCSLTCKYVLKRRKSAVGKCARVVSRYECSSRHETVRRRVQLHLLLYNCGRSKRPSRRRRATLLRAPPITGLGAAPRFPPRLPPPRRRHRRPWGTRHRS